MPQITPLKNSILIIFFGAMALILLGSGKSQKDKILVFTKTQGFVHQSIPAGKAALIKLGGEVGFQVDTTSDSNFFTPENLKEYDAVIFLNTTGDVLNIPQQTAFEEFIRAGGGFVGIHSAADTEYEWPWYGKLVGGYFKSHPHIQKAEVHVVNQNHPSISHLPKIWEREDEWYNYKSLNPEIRVLATLDEQSYEGGENGNHHPIAWYHEYDGGRAFYTGGGHSNEAYKEPLFLEHIIKGILWAAEK